MNRRFATALILALLASLFFLRASPVLLLVGTAIVAVTGMAGVSIKVAHVTRWTGLLSALGIAWFIGRCVVGSEIRALFIGEALFFCIAAECLRIDDWTKRVVTIPTLAVIALVCTMQQRIAFEMLGVYTFLGICVVLAVGWFSTENRPTPTPRFFRKRASVAIAVLGVSGFASFKVSEVMGEQISILENRVETWLSQFTVEDPISPYATSGDLASISLEKQAAPNEVALYVYSKEAPGYMTSRVFDVFDGRRWRIVTSQYRTNNDMASFDTLKPVKDSGIRIPPGENIFRMGETSPSPRYERYEITNVSGRGPMVFFPRSTRFIRGRGRVVTADKAGVIFSGLNTDSKYYAYTDTQAPESFPFEDRPKGDKLRQQVDQLHRYARPETRRLLQPLADELIKDEKDVEKQRDIVVRYLTQNFRYSLTPLKSVGRSKYLNAFLEQKEGHCELFATTAAILMRLKGTKTRYVIGYVCRERDPDDDDYWSALNRNLHAWVEAWDPKQRKWLLVEATPGMAEVTEEETTSSGSSAAEQLIEEQIAGGAISALSDGRWYRVFQWVGLGVTCVMLGWTWLRFGGRSSTTPVANEAILQLDRMLSKQGITRNTGETLHEFADRIEASTGNFDSAKTAGFYRNYASMLYSGDSQELAGLSVPV